MMRTALTLVAALAVVACSSDSSLPVASGKGSVMAINAIPTSPEMGFLIEETLLGGMVYKVATAPRDWDDLDYLFNFEYQPPGILAERVRFATQPLKVKVDTAHTMLVWGDFNAPTITVWEWPEREFNENDTVFELRVSNGAPGLGTVDIYFAEEGVPPVLGQQLATVAPGEVSGPTDFETGEWVVTITPEGDPSTVLYQSSAALIFSRQSELLVVFESDANDTAPVTARRFNNLGATVVLPDIRFPPTRRFIHGTMDLETVDIYDDEAVSNRIVAGLSFGEFSGDIDVAVGDLPITVTAENNTGSILFESTYSVIAGTRFNTYYNTPVDSLLGTALFVNRRSIETEARLTWFHSADNFELVDVYIVDRGESIADALPRLLSLSPGILAPDLRLLAGSYDMYFTTAGEETILEGPIALDLELGDVVEGILLNRVDPTLADFRLIPLP